MPGAEQGIDLAARIPGGKGRDSQMSDLGGHRIGYLEGFKGALSLPAVLVGLVRTCLPGLSLLTRGRA